MTGSREAQAKIAYQNVSDENLVSFAGHLLRATVESDPSMRTSIIEELHRVYSEMNRRDPELCHKVAV